MRPTIRSASLVDYPEIARSVGLDPVYGEFLITRQ